MSVPVLPVSVVPAKRRVGRRRRRGEVSPGPVVELALVSAIYNANDEWVRLSFNLAIDIGGVNAGAFFVDDGGVLSSLMQGTSVQLVDSTTVQVNLNAIDPASGPFTTLTVHASNGIVAVGGGDPWAGVEELGLPYP